MKKDIAFKVIIVTLSCALAFSIYFNFKSPYLPENKEDHLGKITYNLPADCKWIYGDFDSHKMNSFSGKNGGYLFEPETNKVYAKAYVDMNTLSELTIGYNDAEQKLLEKDLVEWSGNHGNVPDCIENLIIASNNSDDQEEIPTTGTYWESTFTIEGTNYIVSVYGSKIKSADLSYIGEELVKSIAIDNSIKDEYLSK